MAKSANNLVELETRIFTVRGQAVTLDADLAQLYGVETKALLQATRRNRDRLPQGFVFHLTNQEVDVLRSQIVTSKPVDGRGGRRYTCYAFTEQGVAMLSSVLRRTSAVQVNIAIMRAFVGALVLVRSGCFGRPACSRRLLYSPFGVPAVAEQVANSRS